MAKTGVPIYNTLTGEKVIFRKTLKDTNGREVEFDQFLPPGTGQAAEHIHLTQDERYTIVSGTASYTIKGVDHTAGPGDVVPIPKFTVHTNPCNTSKEQLHLIRVVDPGDGVEIFYETIYGLGSDRKTNAQGFPNPLQMVVLGQGISATTYFLPRQIPIWLQDIVLPILAFIGRLAGYKVKYPQYSVDD